MGSAPRNRHFDRAVHRVPARVKRLRHLSPTELFRPPGQKPRVRRRHRPFALGPRNPLHLDPARRTLHAPHRIHEVHQDAPEGDELEPTRTQPIIPGSFGTAPRADRPAVLTGLNRDVQHQLLLLLGQFHVRVHKPRVLLNPIEYPLDLHPGSFLADDGSAKQSINQIRSRDASPKSTEGDSLVPGTSSVRRRPSPQTGRRRTGGVEGTPLGTSEAGRGPHPLNSTHKSVKRAPSFRPRSTRCR
jgi:hypothetical protein